MPHVDRWSPAVELTRQEQYLMPRLDRVRRLLGFLRRHRHEIFDGAFQDELTSMYRQTGAGREPVTPALIAMATLVQGYLGVSDAEMIELTVVDLRVQMVLGCLGGGEPPFSQGTLQNFRERFIGSEMDRRLLERTVQLARETREFDATKLPKALRVAMDSAPLEGAGRVEDTVNLLGHAGRKVAECAANILRWDFDRVCLAADSPILIGSSTKRALDIDWNDAAEKRDALNELCFQLGKLSAWVKEKMPLEMMKPPMKDHIETLEQILGQDLEPDPDGGGGVRIREGVAPDRRVSIEDAEMRHGRKSKSKRFNGFKRHIAADLDSNLILACALTPANRPEEEAAPILKADIERQDLTIGDLHIDRGYINSVAVDDVLKRRAAVVCKPWVSRNGKLYPKSAFKISMANRTVTCPGGQTQTLVVGSVVEFEPDICDHCALRSQCTTAELGNGRTIAIAVDEQLQHRLRKLQRTIPGRAKLRQRTGVEHRLAHISRRQGRRARYRGARKNTYDLRRAASIQNLETIHLREQRSAKAA